MPKISAAKILVSLLVLVFIGQILSSSLPVTWSLGIHPFALLGQGALTYKAVWTLGESYRVLTSVFLHVNVVHLFFNCAALGYASVMLERFIGPYWFTAIFLLGGIGGSLCSITLHHNEIVSAGASGGIMALFASMLMIFKILPQGLAFRKSARGDALKILILSLIPISSDTLGMHIDIWGHLGGTIVGIIMGTGLYWTWNREQNRPRFQILALSSIVFCVIWVLFSLTQLYETHQALRAYAQHPSSQPDRRGAHPKRA